MVISQGEVYWIDLDAPRGSEPGYRHPFVVVQNDSFNRSNIDTVVVCALTSNLRLADAPGNVLIKKGEGSLPKSSVVNISQIMTVNKVDLYQRIGKLPRKRLLEVIDGINVLLHDRIF